MSIQWHPNEDRGPTPREAELMAELLEGRHGIHAEAVADFFREFNEHSGVPDRAWTWAMLRERLARRRQARLASH